MSEFLTLAQAHKQLGTTKYELVEITKVRNKREGVFTFVAQFLGDNGLSIRIVREGDDAKVILKFLNTSNNATKTEERRIIDWALQQPEFAELLTLTPTITGTPD